MFRGSERIRLITMLGTLCILGMIVFHSYESGSKKPPADGREIEQTPAGAEKQKSPSGKSLPTEKPAERETVAPGPTDEDSEEWFEAENEFQVLTDGTLGIVDLEMPAYRRVFEWVRHQSFAEMQKRAGKNVPLDGLIRTPDKFRGKLIRIDLNVRHAIPVDGAPLGVKTVYELHGFSEDSGAWMYFAIVPELPEGMRSGADVEERVRVVGYFFKLNGYLEAGAKPRAAPLKAPLLIGRAELLAAPAETAAPADYGWLYPAAAGFVLLSFIITLLQFLARRNAKRHQVQLDHYKIERARAGFNQEHSAPADNPTSPDDSREDAAEGFDFRKS